MTNQQQTEASTQQVENSESTTEGEITLTLDGSIDIPDTIAHCSPAVIGDMVYIKSRHGNVILEYNTISKSWSKITNHPLSHGFSLVNVDGILTTVGGQATRKYSKKSYCYIHNKWIEIFPPMKSRCYSPGVVYTQNSLVVLKYKVIGIMNIDKSQWLEMFEDDRVSRFLEAYISIFENIIPDEDMDSPKVFPNELPYSV